MSKKRDVLKRSDVPDEGPDQMLTVAQAAAIIGCGPETVRNMCKDRLIDHYRSGRRVIRIKRSDLAGYLDKIRVTAAG